jgi:MFS family permease
MSASSMAAGRATAAGTQGLPFIIGASSAGTLIEWYDFYLYGVLAAFFAGHFFPASIGGTQSFIYSLGIFWTGFVVRPFGALFFGHLGDLIGRKFTFMLTLGLMGLATFLVGCLPTFAQIGWSAPILLVTCRVVQGLALGGEYGGAATYIAEHAPDGKRGLYTSWIQTTATLGIVTALLAIMAFRIGGGNEWFQSFGWRWPFWLSAVLVLMSGYIRLKLQESPLYARLKTQGKASQNPALETYSSGRNWGLMALALFGATAPEGVIWYTGQFYALNYISALLGPANYATTYVILMFALIFGAPFFVVFGWLSDRVGRRPIMIVGFVLAVVTYIPVFDGLAAWKDNPVALTLLIFYLVILVTMVYGPIAAFLVEIFPARIRYSSMSMPYHIGNGVFGGGVPFIAASLSAAYPGVHLVGLYYPIAVAAIGVVVGAFGFRQTHRIRIWEEVGGGAPPLVPDQP